jgi:DegV family protein with EDD domain
MTIRIVADTACDIPPHTAVELGITLVPLTISFGHESYREGVELPSEQFYQRLKVTQVLPKTSAPPPGAFAEVYRRLSGEADGILSIHVSSRLSGTYASAQLASDYASCPLEILDSQSASMAFGLLVIRAAEAARQGASLPELKDLVQRLIPRTIVYGLFDTLDYLQKGGRIGRAQSFLGSILRVKPVLSIRYGEVLPVARVRTRSAGIDRLCELVRELGSARELAVVHAANIEEATTLYRHLAEAFPSARLWMAEIGAAVGTYAGPGSFGVAILSDESG